MLCRKGTCLLPATFCRILNDTVQTTEVQRFAAHRSVGLQHILQLPAGSLVEVHCTHHILAAALNEGISLKPAVEAHNL
jgi:hypothetical protein